MPRILAGLGALSGLALGASFLLFAPRTCDRPCGGHAPVAAPEPAIPDEPVVAAEIAEPKPAERAGTLADLVGLYEGPDDCVLLVNTRGQAYGCGLDGQLQVAPDGAFRRADAPGARWEIDFEEDCLLIHARRADRPAPYCAIMPRDLLADIDEDNP